MKTNVYRLLLVLFILLGLSSCAGKGSPEVVKEMNNKQVTKEQVCKGSGSWMEYGSGESCDPFFTPKMEDIKNGVRYKRFEETCYRMKGKMLYISGRYRNAHECMYLRVPGLLSRYTFNKNDFYLDIEKIESKKKADAEKERKAKLKKELEISNIVRKYNAVEDYCVSLNLQSRGGGAYIPSTNSCEVSEYIHDRKSVFAVIEELKKKGQAPTIVKYQNEAKKYEGTLDELCRDLSNSGGGNERGIFDKETLDCQFVAYAKKWADVGQFKYDTMKPLLIEQHKKITKQRKKQASVREGKRIAEEKQRARKIAEYERKAKIKKGKQYVCSDGYDSWVLKYNGGQITFGEVNFYQRFFDVYAQNKYDRNPLYIDRAKGTVEYNGNTSTCKLR